MYGDVNVTVEDGNLGRSSSTGSGVQFKIGISNIESTTPILITGSMDAKKIKEKVGNTPLADACIDSVENGAATIYCIPVKATTDGTIGEVKAVKTGEGTLEVSGKPNNAYDIVIKVTDDGENNEAGYAYSLDGGNTFSEEMTVPLNGEAVLANTGLTAKFTEAAGGDSFKEGDTFSFSTTAPSMSNADVISAVESLINNNTAFEYAHIVGTSSRALWASLASIANDFLTKYKRPLFFVCEARMKRSNESLDEYVAAMQEERKGINNIYIQVVCSNSRYQRMDGRVQDINNAGIVCGLYCKAKESQSIGEVKSFPISEAKMLKLLPEGIEDYIAILDKAKYLTFRQYVGKEDYYVTSANTIQGNVSGSIQKLDSAFGTMQKAGAALTGVGGAILGVGTKLATSTFDTQNALGELSSLGVKDLKAVENAAKSFSDTWAGTSKADFITASYDIKSGIASLTDEGVAQFTQLAALTGKATKSTTEEMGSLFATGYGIYKGAYDDLSDLEFGEMFSAGIATAVKNYKTSGSEMASAISALGATATNNNVPLEEQLAILGQLQTTMSGSEAATKYKSFLNQATKAGEALGLQLTDDNNRLLSTPEILEKLKGKYGETIDAVEKKELKDAYDLRTDGR